LEVTVFRTFETRLRRVLSLRRGIGVLDFQILWPEIPLESFVRAFFLIPNIAITTTFGDQTSRRLIENSLAFTLSTFPWPGYLFVVRSFLGRYLSL
jgi:hypothetical protein